MRAIVDGHIILSRSMAEQGIFPAIDIGKSLSRVATDIIPDEHRRAMANFRRIWSAYEENRDLLLMGAYREGTDANIDEAVARRPDLLDFIRQAPHDRIELEASVAELMQGFGT